MNKFFKSLVSPYRVIHIDGRDYHRDVFVSRTFEDAMQWAACALNSDRVLVTRFGYLIAERAPLERV
jgi:hypothetical protein